MTRRALLALSLLFAPLPALSEQPSWYLLGRHECADLELLAKMEQLNAAPASPQEFVELMRQRGHRVVVGPPDAAPPELAGKIMQVEYGERRLLFVRQEVCRGLR